jgi:hypothetical protein
MPIDLVKPVLDVIGAAQPPEAGEPDEVSSAPRALEPGLDHVPTVTQERARATHRRGD